MSRRRHPPDGSSGARSSSSEDADWDRSRSQRGRPKIAGAPSIVDDWPPSIPVTVREIEVIETYLGTLLDELQLGAVVDD
ncbi:hypothetical protein [Aureimonas phyllosphaerae]|uniref:Uncharacterized protein n=1 Tax=Aureimonas phyllosphaerae TaxID=1166078 RepID=A0A7W6FWV0_9HYPH|nr:hypothetical protein [Aureimonas phyllosphaerae]MBB3937397.1 hypothetical protein [Aureimonas phyllosphaerae]MBB3961537.1 hypothetical protein [Aureimonas phyllosphaerae]